jgi:hypothetical protein
MKKQKPRLKTINITIPEDSMLVQVDNVPAHQQYETARTMCNTLGQTVRLSANSSIIKAEPLIQGDNVRAMPRRLHNCLTCKDTGFYKQGGISQVCNCTKPSGGDAA